VQPWQKIFCVQAQNGCFMAALSSPDHNAPVDHALQGARILITKPTGSSGQRDVLATAIEREGGEAILFPAMEIVPLPCPKALPSLKEEVGQADVMIFCSPNAVDHMAASMPGLLSVMSCRLIAIGAATCERLRVVGFQQIIVGPQMRTEGALLLPQLDQEHINNQRVIIVRGKGGRPLLGDELTRRGALVSYLEVYERRCPSIPLEQIHAIWGDDQPLHLATATSPEIFDNLLSLMPTRKLRDRLLRLPFLVLSKNTADHARRLRYHGPMVLSPDPMPGSMLETMRSWWQQNKNILSRKKGKRR
jgi:uroporphyrinogen-III synthase